MTHIQDLDIMFAEFNASTLRASSLLSPRGINEFKFIVNSGDDSSFIVPAATLRNSSRQYYNWKISWGDGRTDTYKGTDSAYTSMSHSYPAANTEYEIQITPVDPDEQGWLRPFGFDMQDFGSCSQTNRNKILRITSGELTEQAIRVNETDTDVCSYMFHGCSSLTSIGDFNLPQGITTVGNYFCSGMFNGCTSLPSIDKLQLPPGITTVGANFCWRMFSDCKSLTSLGDFQLPQGITTAEGSFCTGMFQNCTNLTSLGDFQIPPGISGEVGALFCRGMFYGCTSLTSTGNINLPQGITTVGNYFCSGMFQNCTNIKTLSNSFFGSLQFQKAELDKLEVFKQTFQNCSIATGDMAGVPMLQLSPTVTNQCFLNTPNVSNVPVNWK